MILVKGIARARRFNTAMVIVKLAVVLFVIIAGIPHINPDNWTPFAPYGLTGISLFGHTIAGQTGTGGEPLGMIAGAATIFFAYIGFDSVSTHAEEAKNPQRDVPIGILASLLICTAALHRRLGRDHGHGAVRPDRHRRADPERVRIRWVCPGRSC